MNWQQHFVKNPDRHGPRCWRKNRVSLWAVVVLLVLVVGCKMQIERGAKASHGEDAASSATGEYKDIRVGKVERGDVEVELPLVGTLAPVSKVEVKSVLSGRVIQLRVREGDVVEYGQVMAILEPGIEQLRELSLITSGVEKAQLEFKDAQLDLENTRKLGAKGFASQDQVKAAEKRMQQSRIDYGAAVAQRQALTKAGVPMSQQGSALKSFQVTAPAAGVVVDKVVEVGEVVSSGVSGFNQGTVLYEVADLSELKVDLFVNEVDISKLDKGYAAQITVDAFRGKKWSGKVSHVAPQARKEGEIRGFDVEIRLEGDASLLRPGMTANVDISGQSKKKVLRAPIESLFKKKGEEVLYTLKDGKPEAVPVGVGLVSMEWVEITSGVEEGVEVALQHPDRYLKEVREEKRKKR